MKLILIFACLALPNFTFAAAATPPSHNIPDIVSMFYVMDSFKSYQSLLNAFGQMGIIDEKENAALTAFLNERHIAVESTPAITVINGKSVSWNNLRLTIVGPNEYKTKDGNLVKLRSSDSPAQKLRRIAEAFEPVRYSRLNLLLPIAYAAGKESDVDLATAAIKTFVMDKVQTGFSGVATGFGVIFGGAGLAAKGVGYLVRKFVTDGSVVCSGSSYLVANGFTSKDFADHYSTWTNICTDTKNLSDSKREADSLEVKFCAFYTSAADYMHEAFTPKLNRVEVSSSWLRKMYHGEPPPCTADNARSVERLLKSKSEHLFEASLPISSPGSTNTEKRTVN